MRYCEGGCCLDLAAWRVRLKHPTSLGTLTEAYCETHKKKLIDQKKNVEADFEPLTPKE